MSKKVTFEIILGSYEEFVLGYRYNKKEGSTTQSFAAHSHSSSVRSVAHCGGFLASGGADDRIVVYDLKTRKEHCMLTHHNSTVNCLQFTNEHTHLISGSQDGTLAIVRVGSWQLEKLWEAAHKGAAILDIAVHSSGKLALTLGADCTLRTWNLVKGRQAYIINLNSKCKDPRSLHAIRWAPDGVRFALLGGRQTDIWSLDTGGILKSIEHKTKVTCCVWENNESLVVGYEDGEIGVVNLDTDEIIVHKAHESRIKCLEICGHRIVSASSSGEIKIFDLKWNEVSSSNAGCRFTCMVVVPPIIYKQEVDIDKESVVDKVVVPENVENADVGDESGISSGDEVVIVRAKKCKKNKRHRVECKTEALEPKQVKIKFEEPRIKKKNKNKKSI